MSKRDARRLNREYLKNRDKFILDSLRIMCKMQGSDEDKAASIFKLVYGSLDDPQRMFNAMSRMKRARKAYGNINRDTEF